MKPRTALPLAALAVVLGACTVIPTGPSIMALPGSRKSLEEYQVDVADCQRYADAVIASAAGGTAANADNRAAASAATGAVLGAATGAIIGSATGQASQGAAIGAGTGLLFGAAAGSPYPAMSSYQLQRGYDQAYLQCMYRRGNQVPVARNPSNARPQAPVYTSPSAAPGGYRPPPPPSAGYPPPANVPPSSYPPPDAPPPPSVPPRN